MRPQERLAGFTLPHLSRWYMSTWSAMVPQLHSQMGVPCCGGQEATAELERLEFASLRPQERLAGSGRPRFCRKCQVRSLKCWSMLPRQTVFWPQPGLALQLLWLPVCKRRNSLAEEGLAPLCLLAGSSLVCWSALNAVVGDLQSRDLGAVVGSWKFCHPTLYPALDWQEWKPSGPS